MFVKSILLVIIFSVCVWAETHTYLVKRAEHFPQDRYLAVISPQEYKLFIDTGKKTITEAGGQPFRMTQYEINFDGKYALWTVTAKDDVDKWRIESMRDKGYIVLLSTQDVVSVYCSQLGGAVTEAVFMKLGDKPTDYYAVEVSTP